MEPAVPISNNQLFTKKIDLNNDSFQLSLSYEKDLLVILIESLTMFKFFESSFNYENLKNEYKILKALNNIEEIYNYIIKKIENNEIEIIKKEDNYINFIIKTYEFSNIEMKIMEKEMKLEEKFEKLQKKYLQLKKNENTPNFIKMDLFLYKTHFIIIFIAIIIALLLKILSMSKKIDLMNEKIDSIINNNKIQLIKGNLHLKNKFKKFPANTILKFPTKNYVLVNGMGTIQIFDENFSILQVINAHDDIIFNIRVKDDNNFITCSNDKSIKFWNKLGNEFINSNTIINAHDNIIYNIIYYQNNKIISCSYDQTIKIWEIQNNNNKLIKTFQSNYYVISILLLEDMDMLVSCGGDGIQFFNLKTYQLINQITKVICTAWKTIIRISYNTIVVCGYESIYIINIINKTILREIKNEFNCFSIFNIENKGIFLVSGMNNIIKVYRSDNYENIQTITNLDIEDIIKGFIEYENNLIISYSKNSIFYMWEFK